MSDSDSDDARLTVVCRDGTEIGCTNFKAIDTGLLLTEDLKKNRVFGFVAQEEVSFVLPAEAAAAAVDQRDGAATEEEGFDDPFRRLSGVGSTYAKRLRAADYDSVAAVAAADPATLADETGAREDETREWVEQAGELADGEDEGDD